ncbi:MAG: EamA family transporter [Chloroflexia bacterium]
MTLTHLLGILSAVASALVWGSGDFAGGRAARKHSAYQVSALAALSGLLLLLFFVLLWREPLPPPPSIGWSVAAGLSGVVGIVALYRGLATGRAAVVAPTSAVVSALVPVLLGTLLEGLPGGFRLAGMLVGVAGIACVSRPSGEVAGERKSGFPLALLAGAGFGGFFVCIARVQQGLVFAPLLIAKAAGLLGALVALLWMRQPFPSPRRNPIGILAGLLDAGGNLLYLLAKQYTRWDIVAVLSSMYPATTVLLARLLAREPVSARQWFGVGMCLLAVVLIAL